MGCREACTYPQIGDDRNHKVTLAAARIKRMIWPVIFVAGIGFWFMVWLVAGVIAALL
jgi:hypothetical protein